MKAFRNLKLPWILLIEDIDPVMLDQRSNIEGSEGENPKHTPKPVRTSKSSLSSL